MIYFIVIYLSIGFGFALASWLQASEVRVKEGKKPSRFIFSKPFVFISLSWWLVAIYCYRAEVKRTIPTYHYHKDDK